MGRKARAITTEEAESVEGIMGMVPAPIQQEFTDGNYGRGLELINSARPSMDMLLGLAKTFNVPI